MSTTTWWEYSKRVVPSRSKLNLLGDKVRVEIGYVAFLTGSVMLVVGFVLGFVWKAR